MNNIKDRVEEKLFKFISEEKYKEHMEKSKKLFYEEISKNNVSDSFIMNFTDWILHNYKLDNKKNFIEEFLENHKSLNEKEIGYLESKLNSYLSIYELVSLKEKVGTFKDIFTNEEISINIDEEEFKVRDLIFVRIMDLEGEKIPCSDTIYIPSMFKTVIEKNIKTYYDEYKSKREFSDMVDFLRNHPMVLYKHVSIVEDVLEKEMEKSEDYDVWQSVYLFQDRKKLMDEIDKSEKFVIDFCDEEEVSYNLMEENEVLAKILIESNKLEVECNSQVMRDEVKKIIQSTLGKSVHHYKDEIVKFEDLI
ncbi:MAG: hypothetical protein N4A57_03655 [Anaeromicrobium sp.]|jgi:hypothetical protein|uniref:hypothetical protein n=1 Tax=Anaeromicrobium sp. TaxID=1929132 RepID=UPI0025D5F330|nr:hypothetical protein [Anaeromicrobium sp.]MCT4593354.1 hypothetical protein [Anaeromicrobium sp.]